MHSIGACIVLGITSHDALRKDLEPDPFLNSGLQRFTFEVYCRFGSFLAPLNVGKITSRHYFSERNITGTKNVRENREEKERKLVGSWWNITLGCRIVILSWLSITVGWLYHDDDKEERTEDEKTKDENLLLEEYVESFRGNMTIGFVMTAFGAGTVSYFSHDITIKDICLWLWYWCAYK